jgi:hypothetical protein
MVVRLARAARRLLTGSAPHTAPDRDDFEGMDHLLKLADRLPSGGSGADVRRSVCELIEANTGVERRVRVRRLLTVIDDVQKRRASGRSRVDDADAAEMEQLRDALRGLARP